VSAQPSRRPDPKLIVSTLPISLQLQRIGGSLTPMQVSDIIRLADSGYVYGLMDLGNEMRQKDNHLQSVLQTREIAIQGLPWQVVPAGNGEKLKNRKRAEFVTEVLQQMDGVSGLENIVGLPDVIAHTAAGDFYGHAVTETLWTKDSGKIVPYGGKPVAPRRFAYGVRDGALRWFDAAGGVPGEGTTYPGVDLQGEYPGRFIVYQPRITGDVSCREGLIRPLMWAALFRNWTTRDWLTLAELAWKPWRTGKYAKTARDQDIAALETILDQMTSSGVAVYPDTAQLELHWPTGAVRGGQSTHKELVDAMGNEMSKAVLGQTETTQPTKGGLGGQGKESQHNDVRKDIRDARAKAIAKCLQRDLVDWIIRINFGEDAALHEAPQFQFLTDDAVDQVAFSTMITNLRQPSVQLRIPAKWVRDQLGIPEPEDDEEVIGPDPSEDIPIDPETGLPKEPDADSESQPDKGGKPQGADDGTENPNEAA
jgi:phage gp29-like protein